MPLTVLTLPLTLLTLPLMLRARRPSSACRRPDATSVFVHLFEWRWTDIAIECERFLGPRGFTAVQISPPSEHTVQPEMGYPWWQRYQTADFRPYYFLEVIDYGAEAVRASEYLSVGQGTRPSSTSPRSSTGSVLTSWAARTKRSHSSAR